MTPWLSQRLLARLGLRFVLFACLAGTPGAVDASTVLFRTDAELIAQSARVVHGRIAAERTTFGGPDGRTIYTVTTLTVIEDLTGQTGDTIEMWELGGIVGDQFLHVAGAVEYHLGDEVLVCLERGPYGFRSVAMNFSKFEVLRGARGEGLLERRLKDTRVEGRRSVEPERSLTEFRQLARAVTGRPSRRSARALAGASESSAEQAFTLMPGGPLRWAEADSGIPVTFYRNATAPAPLLSSDGTGEILTALAAWTNPQAASIVLQYGGAALEPNAKGPWSGLSGPAGVITFEDPYNELSGSTLAIGGGGGRFGTGGIVNGTSFDGFTSAFVIFQNAAELSPSFRQSLNFTRVLTHEIGHTIGLGHTDTNGSIANPRTNIMYASCCFAETPVPPAIGSDDLSGLTFIYPMGTSCTFAVNPTTATFPASGGSATVYVTTQNGCSWTVTSQPSYVSLSPPWITSGTGPGSISFSVDANGISYRAGTLTIAGQIVTISQAGTGPTVPIGPSANPFGVVDTPVDNRTGVTGAIPFTGWAIDDVELASVTICREATPGEVAPVDGNCGGAAQIYVGAGVFIEGARPDVQAAYPGYPRSDAAGWGVMVLTNMLPNGGNGTFVFSVYARDRAGQVTKLGQRSMTCTNASATLPFGTIDTPGQGDTVAGAAYVNFGWALTQLPKVIPGDGSTLMVYVDGVAVGRPTYGNYRADIAAAFPGLANSGGAVGFRSIDTTTLSNGLHTIVWTATDSGGFTEGLGSRYFRVANGTSAVTAAPSTAAAPRLGSAASGSAPTVAAAVGSPLEAARVEALPLDQSSILGRRGWDPQAPWRAYGVGAAGRAVIRGEEIDRFEMQVHVEAGSRVSGHLRVGDQLTALPVGAHLNAETGRFTWAPGVGFVGRYDLLFVRWEGARPIAHQAVRFLVQPMGRGSVGVQVLIDAPASQQDVGQPFLLGGWAADLDAPEGTGIDTLHVWAYPLAGGPPVFLGVATYGGVRPDVATVHGDQFRESAYGLAVQGLVPGNYDLAVFAWSRVSGGFAPATVVRVTVR